MLLDGAHINQADGFEFCVNFLGLKAGFFRVCGVIIVESHMKASKIAAVVNVHVGDELLGCNAFFFGAQHDGSAMRVISADIPAFVAAHFLQAHPDVGLHIAHQMAKMNCAVGVGQGTGDKNFAGHGVR